MRFGVPKEREPGETRIAAVPETVRLLVRKGHKLCVETGAGEAAFISDKEFQDAGAEIVSDAAAVFSGSDCVLKVHAPSGSELERLKKDQGLVCFIWHLRNREMVEKLKKAGVTAFAMDAI